MINFGKMVSVIKLNWQEMFTVWLILHEITMEKTKIFSLVSV